MEGKKVQVTGVLPNENPVILGFCSTIAEVKAMKDEYKDVFPEIEFSTKIIKTE